MIWELTVKDHIDAAHQLHGHPGKCRNLHGHRWEVALTVRVESLDEVGMGADFARIRQSLRDEVVAILDHRLLNEVPPFDGQNPTAENLARFVFERCAPRFAPPARLVAVQVWESPDAWVVYKEPQIP